MREKTTIHLFKNIILFLTLLFCSVNIGAQDLMRSGTFIPFELTFPDPAKNDPPIIRGNMVITGNNILGAKLTWNRANPSENLNHVIPFQSATGPDFIDVSPNDEYIWESHGSNGVQYRGYTDIDSDPNRDTKYLDTDGVPIFQNLLPNESTYAGMNLADGTQTVDSSNPNLLTNGQPLLDEYDAPNYGQWLDGTPSIVGPFEPGSEEGTFSSSAAELIINPDDEACSSVVRAYLYWSGLYSTEQRVSTGGGGINNYTRLTRLRPECLTDDPNNPGNQIPCELYTDIKILPPGASEYVDIKFSNSGADHNSLKTEIIYDDSWLIDQSATGNFTSDANRINGSSASNYNKFSTLYPDFTNFAPHDGWVAHPSYACRADVTSLMQHLADTDQDVDGFWTVANIRTTVGRKGWGLGAGWSLVVVYENPAEPQKYISFFDGYANVTNNAANVPVSGFTTPPAGPINVEFASMSLEGDINLTTDFFEMNGASISGIKPTGVTSNLGYNSANYFDSSILTIDRSPADRVRLSKFPNSLNNLGYDSDHFRLDNSGNSIIGNNDTSANITVSAGRNDQSATYFIGFSVDVIAPNLVVTKQTFREDGSPITLGDDIVDLGDKIVYEIIVENVGNEEAVYTQFEDRIPINTIFNFADSDFRFNNQPLNEDDVTIDPMADSFEVDSNGDTIYTTSIKYDIPDSVLPNGNVDPSNPNGLLDPGESVSFSFSVQVVTDCSLLRNACSGFIENQADVTYSTLIDGTEFEIQSAFEVDACDVPEPAPTPFLADQASCFIEAEPISQCEESILLQAGLGFDEYIWTFDNDPDDAIDPVPFTMDAEGNPTLNQDEIVVNVSGRYTVNQLVNLMNNCQDIFLSFDVEALDSFNPGVDPFENIPDDLKNPLRCSDTGRDEVVEILLCDGDQVVGSDSYPAGTQLSWQRLDTNAGCVQTGFCPFPNDNGSGSLCYVEFDTTNTVTLDSAGDFKLTVLLPGGCPFEYFFKTIEFNVNPVIEVAGGGCAGPAEIEVVSVPANYSVTFRQDDENGAILQGPSATTTYTVPVPADLSNQIIYAQVVPDAANFQGCTFGVGTVVRFSDLQLLNEPTVVQPVCFTDQDTSDGRDDSKGEIFVQVNGAINYTYELENLGTGGTDTESSTISNNHRFTNVDPGNYTLRVFSENFPNSGGETPPGCMLERNITIDEFFDLDVTPNSIQLTCAPAQVNFTVTSMEATPDFSQFTTRLVFPDNSVVSFSGETGSILLADTLNTPNSGVDDEGNEIPDDGFEDLIADKYIDDLLANGVTVTLETFRTSGGGSCSVSKSVTINPFELLQLTADIVTPISCNGDNNGQIDVNVTSGDNISDITGYEIIAATDATQIGRTSVTGVFDNLTVGDYTFVVTQDIIGVNCTTEVMQTLTEPDPITIPVIEIAQQYTCDASGSIDLTNASAIVGGTTPYTYRLLKYSDTALTTLVDTREITDIANLPYENLSEGSFVLEIEDVNNCSSIVSNTISFDPLSVVTLAVDTNPILTCDGPTTTVELSATATNAGVIEGYRITFSSNPAILTSTTFDNTTGEFDLPAGDYEVEAITTNTLCTGFIAFTVADLVNIAAINTGGRDTLTCVGSDDGSASYSISGFSTGGYSYIITRDAAAYTPAASNPQPSTNLTTDAFLLQNLEEGVYEITFLDADTNCDSVVNFSISDPTVAIVSLVTAPQYNCDVTGIGNYTYVVTATGGETPYTFTDGTTSNTDGVFTVNALATAQTISVQITDDNSCPGTPLDVVIPATDDLQLTQTTIEQCLTDGDAVTVPFTGGVAPIQYKLDGTTTFTDATISGTDFIIDTNITVAGSYTYLIVDANNNESCARELEVIFYDDIDISNVSTNTLSCDTSGVTPTTGASITFDVDGGVGAYTYTFETIGNAAAAITPDAGSTDANPTFTFDDSFDEELITITIANASGCGVPTTVQYTPNYPEVPTVDNIDIPLFVCDGETVEVEITPVFEVGEDVNSFVYIFDGVEQFSSSRQYTEGTTSFTYAIRRISTGCISVTGNGNLNSVDPIGVGTITTTPEICMPLTKGTAVIPILNGNGPYEVTVTNLDDSSLPPIVQTTTTNSITFDPLEIGDHLVEVTDANGCLLVDRVEFRIIPEPNVQFRNEAIVTDCVNKVTYFFEIEDGVGPFEIGLSLSTLVDPTSFGDDIANFNDPEFDAALFATVDAGPFNASTNPSGVIDYNRVHSYTRLEFDQPYTVFVRDTDTSCFSSADVSAQPSEDLVISLGTPINTGACALNTGEIPFTFDLTATGLSNVGEDYIAEIILTDGTVDNSVTPVTISSVVATGNTGTITGLPAGSHILRISPVDPLNECSGTADFLIGTEPAMGPLEIAFSRGSSCVEAAQLELRVSGGGGRMPYEYLLMPSGDTPDDSTIFTEAAIISETTVLSFTDATGALIADAFVRDASGCISEALPINIAPLIEPTLTLGLSPEDCDETGLFTTEYTIGNFDVAKLYTFTVNGDIPGNAQITITNPDASGIGTVSAQNRDNYSIEVTASDNPSCPGIATFELAEDVINITGTLGEPDCDGNVDFITVEVVAGGFDGILTRQLVYEVYEGATVGAGTLIATVTPSPIDATITFNSGTNYGSGALSLLADTDYSVRVVDIYDAAIPTGRQCDDVHEGLRKEPVDLPEPVTFVPSALSCSTANDGQIELGITGTSASIDYRLFEFANATDAQSAITSDSVVSSGTEIAANTLFIDGNIFSNLQGVSNAAYVGVVNVTSLSCPIFSTVIELDEPDDTPASTFVIAGINGNCDNTDLVADVLPQVTIQIAGTFPTGITAADYEISISPSVGSLTNPFTFADLALVPGSTDTYTIDANSLPSQTYTVSIRDTNTTCPALEYTQTVFCDTELDQLTIAVTNPAIPCFDVTATSTVSFDVTPANGNPLLFDYTVTSQDDPSVILDSGTDITTSPITIAVGLLEGDYILNVKDNNEARIPPVITEFDVTMPDSLPSFSLGQERTGCDMVEITATPVIGSGTPNVSDPAYTFEISTDGTTFTPMTPTATGNATAIVTTPATGVDTYTIRITDANTCPFEDTIDIDAQEQLTATATENDVCLNEGDANAIITITTGTPPFSYVRTNTGTGVVETVDNITNTSFPIEIEDTIEDAGNYEYVVTDSFDCTSVALPVTINSALTLEIVLNPASTACDLANNAESSSYDLTVAGGNGTYTYEVAIGEAAINTNNFIGFAGPNYVVDPTQEGERFVFRVSDGLSCIVIDEPALITFPTFPEVTFSNIRDIECPGANGMADLTVTLGMGQAPYEIFVTPTGTPFPTTGLAGDPLAGITFNTAVEGIFDFKVRDANGCESAVGNFAISNSVIILKNFDIQDITCVDLSSDPNSGSITLSVSNAEHPITFNLFEDGNATSIDTQTLAAIADGDEVTFANRSAGDYTIEVTDANGCTNPFEFDATINTNSAIVIGDFQVIDENCVPGGTGITIAFPVDGLVPILLQDPINGTTVVDPSLTGDNIFKFDEFGSDPFPNSAPPVTLGADDLFFVISGLAADTEYTIIAQDNSNCQQERIIRTPANDEIVNVAAVSTPESLCFGTENTDGTITVTFEIGTSLATSFDIYLFDENETAIVAPTQMVTNIVPEATFSGLDGDATYIVRVTEGGESALCGNPFEVEVEKATELILDAPSFAAANCQNSFIVPVTASAQFGVPPYEFAIEQGSLATSSVGAVFSTSNVLSANTNVGVDLIWTVFVRDASGCEKPQVITITNEPEPIFVIDPEFSIDQCEDAVASYTVTAEITNYDVALEPYTFTVDGTDIVPIMSTAGMYTFEVPNRDTYIFEAFDKNGCDDGDDDSITIFDLLEVTASLGTVSCEANVTEINYNVTGGYIGGSLSFEVFAVNNLSTPLTIDAVDTATQVISFTTANALDANTDYVVVVTDSFSTATSCSATSDPMRFEEIEKSTIKATPQDITCNGAGDGIVLIEDLTVGVTPVTYELYFYTGPSGAQNAVNSNDPLTGSDVTANVNSINERLFENLDAGFYVAFVRNSLEQCYTASEVVQIEEPALFTGAGLDAQSIQPGCDPQTAAGIRLEVIGTLDGEAPYFYRVPGLVENFTEITNTILGGTTTVPGVVNTNTTYNVEFTDASGIVCVPAITIPVTIDPFTGNPNLDLASQDQAYDCFNEEAITLEVTNRLGVETYTFTNITAIDFDGAPITTLTTPSTTDTTSEFVIPIPGRYIFQATSSLGCESNEFEYVVRELDQLLIEAAGSIVACFGDTSTIEFDILNYTGDFNYEIEDLDNSTVYTGGSVTDWNVVGGTLNTVDPVGLTSSINSLGLVEVAGLPVANYEIRISGSTNARCQNTGFAQIIGPENAVSITSTEALTDITCVNLFAEVQIMAEGGFGNYQYEISGGTLGGTISNETGFFDITNQIGAGSYTIAVFDLDNLVCIPATTTLEIDAPIEPILDDTLDNYTIECFGGTADVRVELANTPTANTDDLRYSLFAFETGVRGGGRVVNQAPNATETFVIFTDIEAGEYLAEVSDIFGCVYDYAPITVTEPALLELSASVTDMFSCDNIDFERYTVLASGGTAPYTYTIFTETDTQLNSVSTDNAINLGGGIFDVSPFRIVTIEVTDDNGCKSTTVIETGKTIDPIEFEIEATTDKICFGEADGFVSLLNDVVTGGEGNYVYTLYTGTSATDAVPGNQVATNNVENFFGDLTAGSYVYEVTSNNCMAVTRSFTIEEEPEIVENIEIIEVSCGGADDAEVAISVVQNLSTPFETPVSFTYTLSADDGSFSASFTKNDLNDPAEFVELVAGLSYTWTIFNNNTIGCLKQGTFTIADKTDIVVQDFTTTGGLCRDDIDGAIQLQVSGGVRTVSGSYYYGIRTDFADDPDQGAIKALGNELVPVMGDTTGNLFTVLEVFDTDIPYEIIILDEGNFQNGDDFRACMNIQEFIFETENLDSFTTLAVANCETLGYTISAINTAEVDNPEELRIYVFNSDNSLAATGGANLADVEVLPGNYFVRIGNETTTCQSITPISLGELEVFEPVQFIVENDLGEPVQPFIATNEINVYRLQVQGGVDPTAAEPYIYEATYTDMNGNVQVFTVEEDGTFEVIGSGAYFFTVFDNQAEEGEGCSDTAGPIGLNFIDIDIPNVFNPTSNDPLTNTWYPDNLTSDFTKGGGINNPLTSDDPNAPQIPILVENTGGTVIGGTTTNGTTTGGFVTGGDIISNTSDVSIATIPNGTSSITYTAIGGTTTGGETTGGYIVETTTNTSGVTSVIIYTGGTIQGGTTTTGGIVTGGTFDNTNANQVESVTPNADGEYIITIGGTTTGGTTSGGTTSGGVTVGDTTTGGTTFGATITDATTISGTTIVITDDGSASTTIEAFTNTTINGGTGENGTTTGGTTVGGTITGGISTPIGLNFIDYENIEVLVFDRYGRLLAEFEGIEEKNNGGEGWDGTYQGKDMPSGDYWYLIRLNDEEGREFTGHFTLYRK